MDTSSSVGSVSKPITISYRDLTSDPDSGTLRNSVQNAFGSEQGCLGILLIKDLPEGFTLAREKLFRLAHRFANLPEEVREELSHPECHYLFGWSHGKEVMNGRPDTQKGSYYANPLLDCPAVSDDLRRRHPEYYAGNVWPRDIPGMEDFEPIFKLLGRIIFDVGCALARACQHFVEVHEAGQAVSSIEALIAKSKSNKARLLHYYPEPTIPSSISKDHDKDRIVNDALCGTHVDHSLLTGLCSAMYMSESDSGATPIAAPQTTAGLYIYPRSPKTSNSPGPDSRPKAVKVEIPPDCIAFQTGETLELLTGGTLAATPHFVSGNTSHTTSDHTISRETFAFFLQPDVDDVISPEGETFGEFTKRVLSRHYAARDDQQSTLPEEAES